MTRRALVAALVLAGCGDEEPAPEPDFISRWDLFADAAAQTPNPGVIPYDVISPLFSDYASKHRFIRLPDGARLTYAASGPWQFPEGTVLVKSFGFYADLRDPSAGERIIETRLLVKRAAEWQPFAYEWNGSTTEAELVSAGARVPVSWIDSAGQARELTYRIPNHNQCKNCHGGTEAAELLGVRTDQVDRDNDYGAGAVNQIDHFESLGLFDGALPAVRPAPLDDPFGAASVTSRARAYLDANCAHCHNATGAAAQSGLDLSVGVDATAEPLELGICKVPAAAGRGTGGRSYGVVPGAPDASIMLFRVESEDPGIKMPELPSQLSHREGAQLIRDWIANMTPTPCN